jgi:hypothetical protein
MSKFKVQIKSMQAYFKFPLTLPLSPLGEREGVKGRNVRRKFSELKIRDSFDI